jgi:membrane protein implicated in regulation of membrane protease activity
LIKYSKLEKILIVAFFVVLALALLTALVFDMSGTALQLFAVDFLIASVAATFGSLRIRDEEEEKYFD